MARKLTSDKVLFVALVALSLFGCVMIYSASAVSAGETSGNPYRYLRQADRGARRSAASRPSSSTGPTTARFARPWVVYGAYGVDARCWRSFALFRPPINGARRWIPLGVDDAAALGAAQGGAGAAAGLPARAQDREGGRSGARARCPRSSSPVVAAAVVVLQPDLGTAVCYVMLCAVLLWLAGARARWFAVRRAGDDPAARRR